MARGYVFGERPRRWGNTILNTSTLETVVPHSYTVRYTDSCCVTSSAANFKTAVNGVFSGTLNLGGRGRGSVMDYADIDAPSRRSLSVSADGELSLC